MEVQSERGVKKVLLKLETSINNGDYYEAHQMYRTLYFRYLAQKKYNETLQLLYNGSFLLLQKEQYTSGAELGILFIDVLVKADEKPSQSHFQKIITLLSMMTPTLAEREVYIQKALQWSITGTNYKNGHPYFHRRLAQVFWNEKNYQMAKQHFMYTKDGSGCASMIIEIHSQHGYSNEIDLFIARIVLQYLCLHNKASADEAFKTYVSQHPQIQGGPPFILPLLNFIFFLLKTIEMRKLSLFTYLCEQYQPCLSKDPSFFEYLERISQLFFGVKAMNDNRRGGVFGSFLQSLFNNLEEDDMDDK